MVVGERKGRLQTYADCSGRGAGREKHQERARKQQVGRNERGATEAAPLGRNRTVLLAGTGRSGGRRLSARLGDAQVAADLVLADLVDDDFLRLVRTAQIEEERLIDRAILVLGALVLDGQH